MKKLIAGRIFVAAVLIGMTTACSSADERLCETALKASLLNPETAQFYDFNAIDKGMFLRGFFAGSAAKNGPSPTNKAGTAKMLDDMIKKTPAIRFYSVRMKADGKLGNRITSMQVCIVDESDCDCKKAS